MGTSGGTAPTPDTRSALYGHMAKNSDGQEWSFGDLSFIAGLPGCCYFSPVNIWYNLKQIATDFFFAGMHSGEVSLKHTKNPLRHLWGEQVKSAIKVTVSH